MQIRYLLNDEVTSLHILEKFFQLSPFYAEDDFGIHNTDERAVFFAQFCLKLSSTVIRGPDM